MTKPANQLCKSLSARNPTDTFKAKFPKMARSSGEVDASTLRDRLRPRQEAARDPPSGKTLELESRDYRRAERRRGSGLFLVPGYAYRFVLHRRVSFNEERTMGRAP